MFSRINICQIISDHFRTLRSLHQTSDYLYWKDAILFLLIPALVTIVLFRAGLDITKYLGNLIAAMSILAGFLFNLLAIIYSQIDKIKNDAKSEDNILKQRFVKEIHVNISFSIVLAVLVVGFLVIASINLPPFRLQLAVKVIIDGICVFLMIVFALTLLMVLNRIYLLFKKEI